MHGDRLEWRAGWRGFRGGDAAKSAARPDKTEAARSARRAAGATFDFYLMALTVHPAFCADGHSRQPGVPYWQAIDRW